MVATRALRANFFCPLAFRLDIPRCIVVLCCTHTTRACARAKRPPESIPIVRPRFPSTFSCDRITTKAPALKISLFHVLSSSIVQARELLSFGSLSLADRHNFCILKRHFSFFVINPLNAEIGCRVIILPRTRLRRVISTIPRLLASLLVFFSPSTLALCLPFKC